MTTVKQLGIWLDHQSAHVIEFASDINECKTITSDFSSDDKSATLSRSENQMHNKEQQKQGAFYKELADIIKDFNEVLLFGPTDAKLELQNVLRENHHFDAIKIDVKTTDKMTEGEKHHFVKEYFTRFDFKN